MLTYAFDLLTLIYEEEGYAPTEIPALILRHNLHGLEICPRAAQLAELALVFKARQSSRRFFQPEHLVRPRIIELRDVRFAENELRDYIHALGLGDLFNQPMLKLLHQFEEAKNFGSLIQPCLDERAIAFARRAIEAKDLGGQLFLRETHLKVLRVLEQAEALTQRYHVVVANPPYMGAGGMNQSLKAFVGTTWPEGKSDLLAAFIEKCLRLTVPNGFVSMVTMQSWLFAESFADLRRTILSDHSIRVLTQIGYNSFPTLNSKIAQGAAFIITARGSQGIKAAFINLNDAPQAADKEKVFLEKLQRQNFRYVSPRQIEKVPGMPLSVTLTDKIIVAYDGKRLLGDEIEPRVGMSTSDTERFVRRWFEVATGTTGFGCTSLTEAKHSLRKWFPFNKGGLYRRWFGNHEFVVNYRDDGAELKHWLVNNPNDPSTTSWARYIRSPDYYFRAAITWSKVSSSAFAVRVTNGGFIFSDASNGAFPDVSRIPFFAGLLNSRVAARFLEVLSPTLNFYPGDVARIPEAGMSSPTLSANIQDLVVEAVEIARADWDNFETSWDFRDQPLLRPGLKGATLEASWRNWEAQSTAAIRRMQELETENNRLFIAAYGLDGELQPEVPEAQITLARAEARRDMAAFLSYAVGCMLGRYSPEHPGLILANAGDSLPEFLKTVGKPLDELTFSPDEDGILPVLDGEWFEDDIVARTREFLAVTFPESSVAENLRFIEESLGKDIRKYFCTEFYKDHLQTYKKRPIYWLVQSPKKGFACLIYLHRYTKDTLNQVLNNYFRPYLQKLEARLAQLGLDQLNDDLPARERTAARREAEKITKVLKECQAWEQDALLPLAQQRIELDLDDGVKVNYLKLQDVLAPIPGLAAKED